jgi:hypothetical protein
MSKADELMLQREAALWKDFDLAVCGFCAKQQRLPAQATLISTLVGDGTATLACSMLCFCNCMVCYSISDLEWFGSHGILFIVHKLIDNEYEKDALASKCVSHESALETEMALNRSLRRQLSQLQRSSQDSEWRLQEQLAGTVTDLATERAVTLSLRAQIAQLERHSNELELSNIESISNAEDNSPATSVSVATTPAAWRDRRSLSSAWSAGGSRGNSEKLLRVAEKLSIGIDSAEDDHQVI